VTADVVWECIGTSLQNCLYIKYVAVSYFGLIKSNLLMQGTRWAVSRTSVFICTVLTIRRSRMQGKEEYRGTVKERETGKQEVA
jgi:hypothetical protein